MRYWQKCPICNGTGVLVDVGVTTTATTNKKACDVCLGKKIIESPDDNNLPYIPYIPWVPQTTPPPIYTPPNTIPFPPHIVWCKTAGASVTSTYCLPFHTN